MLERAKEGLKNITAHSIGKVAEAKARKQCRMQRALTKVKKKAEAVAAKEDLSEREKAREVEKLYNKKLKPKKQGKTLVIGRKFSAGGGGKSHGLKMVDSRLRSDTRGAKRATKKSNTKSKGKHGGAG